MPNNCLSVLYKHIIQVGLKVGGGRAQTYHCPPIKNVWGAHAPSPPPPPLHTPVKWGGGGGGIGTRDMMGWGGGGG